MESSLKSIADAANVSESTVSRALSEDEAIRSRVKPETLDRVVLLAELAGYTPNLNARCLKTRQTKTIGIVVTSAGDPFWSKIIETAERVFAEVGWNLFIGYSHNDNARELEVISSFLRRRVDGIMLAASRIGTSSPCLQQLLKSGTEILMINREGQGMVDGFHYVGVDDELGGFLAASHLIAKGHKRIAYLGIRDRSRANYRRRKGYIDALSKANIEIREDLLYTETLNNLPMEAGIQIGKKFAHQLSERIISRDVTALFCFNDILAAGAHLGFHEKGIQVPNQCSIVGFDNLTITELTSPTITTIQQPREELGLYAANLLLSVVGKKDKKVITYLSSLKCSKLSSQPFMKPRIIERNSTSSIT